METIELSNGKFFCWLKIIFNSKEIWVVNTFSVPVAKATVKIGNCKNIEEVKEEIKKHAVDLDLWNKRFDLKKEKDGNILDFGNKIAIDTSLAKQTIYGKFCFKFLINQRLFLVSVFDSTEKGK